MKATNAKLDKSELVERLPIACADENAAVEFFEEQRWGTTPFCPQCQSKEVYKMLGRDGARNRRFLWRCRACGGQHTVRIGTVYEESRIPLRHWAYAFWRACSSKKGVSALEIQRHCQISYKSALFLMHRVRFALTPNSDDGGKLGGTVECDETYVGGKPRPGTGKHTCGRGTKKTPVVAMLERGGKVRTQVVTRVSRKNLKDFVNANIAQTATVNTDEFPMYRKLMAPFAIHQTVCHSAGEYTRRNADGSISHTNTAESFFSLLKRGIVGTFHAVSKEHLHRYCGEFAFRWDTRNICDGDRIAQAIKSATGKRLPYVDAVAR